jgi:diaminopimelate decarboxylase
MVNELMESSTDPQPFSPNLQVQPASVTCDDQGHLFIGGCDTVELANNFGTPLWIVDEQTVVDVVAALKAGLSIYPNAAPIYAGKAFLCLAMCQLMKNLGMGLDVVSEGELYTASKVAFPTDSLYLQGNNKSAGELSLAFEYGAINVIADSEAELELIEQVAQKKRVVARVLLRIIPGIDLDTHDYIKTGHHSSKFGIPVQDLSAIVSKAPGFKNIQLVGLHAHIGSQAMQLEPYLETIETIAGLYLMLKGEFGIELSELDVGGGLGIAYVDSDSPIPMYTWAREIALKVIQSFEDRSLKLPKLLMEPGRAIIGTAGVTLYRAGAKKQLPGGECFLAVDGGMADNPRPITYQAKYTACVANKKTKDADTPLTLVGKYCESGDVIIDKVLLDAEPGDLIAVFGTGAYNYSQSSNYNRTGRPACVLVHNGQADVIIERESNEDLLRNDRLPGRLLE